MGVQVRHLPKGARNAAVDKWRRSSHQPAQTESTLYDSSAQHRAGRLGCTRPVKAMIHYILQYVIGFYPPCHRLSGRLFRQCIKWPDPLGEGYLLSDSYSIILDPVELPH